MDDSSTLSEYQKQLEAVRQALEHAEGDQRVELLDLKNKLEEVILLLQGVDGKPSTNMQENTEQKPSIDDEFALFQKEIQALECEQVDEKTDTENHLEDRNSSGETGNVGRQTEHELLQIVSSLEGTKCCAPFRQASGECTYHNALVVSAEFDPSSVTSIEDIQATVMFCNPVCEEMKPCEYFLNGSCRFSDSKCRYSHGHQVSVADLKEFVLPDLRNLNMDSKCLAKGKDGIWTKATVEKCLDDQKCLIKYDVSGETDTVELDCIIPIEENCKFDLTDDEDGDDDSSLSQDIHLAGCDTSDYLTNSVSSNSLSFSSCPVAWEQHTKGIGSKLLEKMGHIWGQGLGKNSDGRLEPVEAVILPAGKSLDKCIEMREKCDTQGPISIETRMSVEQDKEEQRAKKAKAELKPVKKETVFDFINSRISAVKDDGRTLDLRKSSSLECQDQKPLNKSLNVQLFAVGEDISRVKRNLSRLQQSLQRNSNRNESTRAQIQRKIAAESDTLRNLQQKESRLSKEIKTQNSQKKLTVF